MKKIYPGFYLKSFWVNYILALHYLVIFFNFLILLFKKKNKTEKVEKYLNKSLDLFSRSKAIQII